MTPRSSGSHTENRKPAPIANWSKLSRADYVQIHQHGEVIATGRIDMLAADGSVLWLHLAGGNESAIFLRVSLSCSVSSRGTSPLNIAVEREPTRESPHSEGPILAFHFLGTETA